MLMPSSSSSSTTTTSTSKASTTATTSSTKTPTTPASTSTTTSIPSTTVLTITTPSTSITVSSTVLTTPTPSTTTTTESLDDNLIKNNNNRRASYPIIKLIKNQLSSSSSSLCLSKNIKLEQKNINTNTTVVCDKQQQQQQKQNIIKTTITNTTELLMPSQIKSSSSSSSSPLPPSVIISDHSSSTDDPIIVHSIIQFDSDSAENDDELSLEQRYDSIYSSTSSLSSSSMADDYYYEDIIDVDVDVDGDDNDSVFQSSTNINHSLLSSSLSLNFSGHHHNKNQDKIINNKKCSKWRKVQSLVPFIQTYRRKKYPWIQLAGHQGNFLAGLIQGTIMKKLCGNEIECFKQLMSDTKLSVLVPQFKQIRIVNNETYLELEDLLAKFINPSVMDIKMGTRTYLEDELVKANEKPRLRKDMFEKMIAIDPKEPNDEERQQKAITKPRYMIWRETISSTSTLGFRIDGMKSGCNNLQTSTTTTTTTTATVKDFKRTKSVDAVRAAILEFVGDKREYLIIYMEKLISIRKLLEGSNFFQTHEMIGSSLLFVHDLHNANIWMIDFAKTYPLPDNIKITHRNQWKLGNHEDGYLFGLDNLIQIFSSLCM